MDSPEVVVKARHLDLSSRFREHVSEKLARVTRFGVPLRQIDVEVSKETNPRLADRAFEVELTCRGRGPVIRAEAAAPDEHTALDLACARLEERLRRQADRHRFHRHGKATTRLSSTAWNGDVAPNGSAGEGNGSAAAPTAEDADDTVFEDGPVVVREKSHPTTPMSVEQAVTQMELIGHDFFLFIEAETADTALVYRRRGFDYGLIRVHPGELGAG